MFFMADTLNFTLALIDKISAPAKAAAAALSTLETQLQAVKALVGDLGKISIKVPKLPGLPKEQLGPTYGPGRKEQAASAKYAEREQLKLSRAAESLDKQRSSALLGQHRKDEQEKVRLAKDAERQTVGYHVAQIKKQQAEDKARKHAEEHLGIHRAEAGVELANFAGAGGALGLAGEVKQLGQAFQEVTGVSPLAAIGIAGFALAAVEATKVVFELAHGFAELVIEGAHMALEAVEAKEKTLDLLEAMLGSEEAAHEVASAIGQITKVTGVTGSRVAQLARELSAAGEAGELLTGSMRAIAQAETVLPEAGAKLQKLTERAIQTGKFTLSPKQLVGTGLQTQKLYEEISRRTGVGVKLIEGQLKAGKISAETGIAALNEVISNKFGGVAAKQAKDFDVQIQRFHANIGKLFKDVKVDKFLDGLQEVLSVFDQSTIAGAALHDIVTAAFDGVFKVAEATLPYIKTFLKGLVIIALQIAIALKPVIANIRQAFGGEAQSGPIKLAETMSLVGQGIGQLITWAVRLGPVFSAAWSVLSLGIYILEFFAKIFFALPLAIANFIGAIVLAAGWISRFGDQALEAGTNVVTGLIDGIKNAAGQLYDTVVNLATTALDKFKGVFGIHSPSKVMAKMGGHLSAGLSGGIHAGARASAGAMVGAGAHMAGRATAGLHAGIAGGAGVARLQARAGAGVGLDRVPPHIASALELGRPANTNQPRPEAAEAPRLAEPSGRQRGGSAPSLTMEAGAVVINGVSGAAEIREMFPEMMSDWWERAALSTGTG